MNGLFGKAGTAGRRVEGDLEKMLPKVDLFMSGAGCGGGAVDGFDDVSLLEFLRALERKELKIGMFDGLDMTRLKV